VTFLRRPEVPGRWSENGVVGMRVVAIGADHFLERSLEPGLGPSAIPFGIATILGSLKADATAKMKAA
jgi:hypothetical protein